MKEIISIFIRSVFRRPKMQREKKEYDCIIVCGYPANAQGKPSDYMKTRVDKAVALCKDGSAENIILSGGAVANEYTEAEIMKSYAMEKGIAVEKLIEEKEAKSTYHNMMYAKVIMNEKGYRNCIVVTNGWHIRKADHYARKFGLNYVMAKADNPEGEPFFITVWRYISINLHMYYMMFKGYY